MQTIDMAKLVTALKQAPPSEDLSIMEEEISPYLLKHVIMPYLNGQTILLANLDFSAFTREEIQEARETIEAHSVKAGKTLQFAAAFRSIAPMAVKKKSFC